MKKLQALDPDADSFADDVAFHVADAVENEPALRSESAGPRRTSAPMTPAPTSQQLTREDLAAMSADEIDAARRRGLLEEILGRR